MNFLVKFFRQDEAGVLIALSSLILFFALTTDSFMTLRTWGSIVTFATALGVIAIGASLLMIAGEYDLSVGSMLALGGMVFSMGVVNKGMSSMTMLVLVLILGAVVGLLNGIITQWTKIPSFITTLGSMLIIRGVVLAVSEGFPVAMLDEPTGVMVWLGHRMGEGFHSSILLWIALAGVTAYALKHTAFGNHLLATGGDAEAARGMGVNIVRIKLLAFSLSGFLAALAGVILFAHERNLSPVTGESYELYAIASAVIGGTLLTGGRGSVLGTVMGTLLIGVVQAGLVHAGVESYWFRTLVGILLIVAVVLNMRIKIFSERFRGRTA